MECNRNKRNKKRNRRRRRQLKKLQAYVKFEVRSEKKHRINKNYGHQSVYVPKEKLMNNTMDANAFWENYNAAHEWQKRHNTTWWKTRCFALEHENYVLKETIRGLMHNQNGNNQTLPETNPNKEQDHEETVDYEEENCGDENLEFHLNEDMMNFLAKSIRHKIELKNQRENEASDEKNQQDGNPLLENMLEKSKKRSEDAKLLYGEASTKILAMETALQTSIDRHIDKAKPQYWPNIPLNL